MILYSPNKFTRPEKNLNVPSAWMGIEAILEDLLEVFRIKRNKALEFGVEFGYSIVALSNYFEKIIGVDTFEGDQHTYDKNIEGMYEAVKANMPTNVELIKSRYQDYKDDSRYDLIHIDIVHTYEDTFACGNWALQHSDFVIFHDTQSFLDVMLAVIDLSKKHNVDFFNYPHCNGLGILWRKSQ